MYTVSAGISAPVPVSETIFKAEKKTGKGVYKLELK